MNKSLGPLVKSIQKHRNTRRFPFLDAYGGFVMLILCSEGFGAPYTPSGFEALSKYPFALSVATQFRHVEWEGLTLWDLIQPAFLFTAGISLYFSVSSRREQGTPFRQLLWHFTWRSIRLLALSQILLCISTQKLHFQLINVLSQMTIANFLCYLIMQLDFWKQLVTAVLILGGHWLIFGLFPGSQGPFSQIDNIGRQIDLAILGYNYDGFYVTINFISSTVTTLIGVWTGGLLVQKSTQRFKMQVIILAIAICICGGLALSTHNPIIKRLWTASFTLLSAGWVLAMFLFVYWLIEVRGHSRLSFPLIVVGVNSIFIYSFDVAFHGWVDRTVAFTRAFEFIGFFAPVFRESFVLLFMWYLCYFLYRRKIFFKI